MTNLQRGTIIAIGCAITFGLYPAAIRAVYADGGNSALVIIVTTWARAALLMAACILHRKPIYNSYQIRKLALSGGIMQSLSTIGIIGGLVFLPGPVVLIILFTHTLMLLFFMAWRGQVKLDFLTVASTVCALFGLTLVVDIWHTQTKADLIGIALALMAALATASRLYAFGQQTKTRDPAAVGAETFLVAGLIVSCIAFFQPPRLPTMPITYLYLALACASLAIATFAMFYSIALIGAFRYSLMVKMEPVFTALFSFLILGEILKPLQYFGMMVVLGSLATYQVTSHLKATRAKALDISESVEAIS